MKDLKENDPNYTFISKINRNSIIYFQDLQYWYIELTNENL